MNRCPRCKSDALVAKKIEYFQEFEGNIYIVEQVPANVCEQCGEVVLSERTAEMIQHLIWSGAKPQRIRAVPVYEVV